MIDKIKKSYDRSFSRHSWLQRLAFYLQSLSDLSFSGILIKWLFGEVLPQLQRLSDSICHLQWMQTLKRYGPDVTTKLFYTKLKYLCGNNPCFTIFVPFAPWLTSLSANEFPSCGFHSFARIVTRVWSSSWNDGWITMEGPRLSCARKSCATHVLGSWKHLLVYKCFKCSWSIMLDTGCLFNYWEEQTGPSVIEYWLQAIEFVHFL